MIKDACHEGDSSRLLPGLIYEITSVGPAPLGPSLATLQPDPGAEEGEGERSDLARLGLGPGSEPVPGYHLASRIGQGSTGEVWKAVGPGGFPVAMKFVGLGERDAADELRSLSLMKGVRHANLLTIFGAWQLDGLLVVGMDLADGTVMDRCAEAIGQGESGIPFRELATLMEQAARGLDFLNEPRSLHGRDHGGLIHRDIKPQNLLLVGGSVKLGDFGLVAPLDAPSEIREAESPTSAYIPPEWSEGRIARQSDQYALAMTYCRLRSGKLPTPRSVGDPASRREPDLTMLPERERPVLARALASRPEDRWANCLAFVSELIRVVGADHARSGPAPGRPLPSSDVIPATGKALRGRSRLLAAASLTLMFFATGRWFARVEDPAPPRGQPRIFEVALPLETRQDARPEVDEGPEFEAGIADGAGPSTPNPTWTRAEAIAAISSMIGPVRVKVRRAFDVLRGAIAFLKENAPPAGPEGLPVIRHSVAKPVVPEAEAPAVDSAGGPIPSGAPKPDRGALVIPDEREAIETDAGAEAYLKKARAVEAKGREMAESLEASRARPSTINVLMPDANAELVVKGDVGKGSPEEWYGPRRVVHTPPLDGPKDYHVGSSWTDRNGRPRDRSKGLKVKPGRSYEVDLRISVPTFKEVDRSFPPGNHPKGPRDPAGRDPETSVDAPEYP